MSKRYNQDFILEVVNTYAVKGSSLAELSAEYNVPKSTIAGWIKKHGEECQYKNTTATPTTETVPISEVHKLNQQLREKEKQIEF